MAVAPPADADPVTKTVVLSAKTYDVKAHESAPLDVQPGLKEVRVSFDTTQHTDPGAVIAVEIFASQDGVNWRSVGACSRVGGPSVDKEGNPVTEADVRFYVEDGQRQKIPMAETKFKIVMKVTGKPVPTSVSLSGA